MPAVLIVTTGAGSLGGIQRKLGAPLAQLGLSRSVFEQAGWRTVVMSPQGGEVAFDSGSVSEKWLGEGKLTTTTAALTAADPTEFDAALIVGGHGALADLVHNADLHRILASFVEEGKPIGAVDHGAAVLTSVR